MMAICGGCGSKRGKKMLDPYEEDVNDKKVEIVLCKKCVEALCEEI